MDYSAPRSWVARVAAGIGPAEEAARDLVRAREDSRSDLMAARHRLSKLLLCHGFRFQRSTWTLAYDAWLRSLALGSRPLVLAFDES